MWGMRDNYRELLKVLQERKANGMVIAESPNLEDEALLLQRTCLEFPV
jgi:hypothetical protein